MGFRRRNYEFEADLYKVPTPWLFRREMGELERTSYQDGEGRLKISVRGVDAPDGATVAIVVNDKAIAELSLEKGRTKRVLSSNDGDAIPDVEAGQEVEIRLLGNVVLTGVFKLD